jgi:hypothetical protein
MRQALTLHPDFRCAAVTRLEADVTRAASGRLAVRYIVTGAISDLALPQPAAPMRADELWRHSCFEAFIRGPSGEAYREFNFAPSGAWAAYRFDGYRRGMANAEDVSAPNIATTRTDQAFELTAQLDLPGPGPWRLGLSAVIEAADGGLSYWALAHPPGKADFHHADGFALEIPANKGP